jgi:hypothetical protein
MEILAEIVFAILQFLGELFVQIFFEALAEIGLHSVKETFRRRPNPVFAALGYVILGAIAGGLSLLAFPQAFIASSLGRIINLILTPLVSGVVMVGIGALRRRRDQELVRLDKFGYGFVFALSMAVVRYVWATGGA